MNSKNKYIVDFVKMFNSTHVYLTFVDLNKAYNLTIDAYGILQSDEFSEGESFSNIKPLFKLNKNDCADICSALTEGLKNFGYVAEVDNAQRISAEAISQERKSELDYFKELNTKLIENFMTNKK